MISYDIVIIGGGPAGLAAAVSARKSGIEKILILERDKELGGILNQCIHNGFGLHTFKEELTGPEYAYRFIEQVLEEKIEYKLNTMVMDISPDRVVTAMSREDGMYQIQAGAVILAMGCRERPRGALNIPGYRPAGIFSAGTAQRLVNIEGYMPGREVVILGSGDIGLIPENELSNKAGIQMNPVTSGPIVNESLETNIPGVFACGNVLHVHDLVDYVSEEATKAGANAAKFVQNGSKDTAKGHVVELKATDGARYTVPCTVDVDKMEDLLTVRFRVGAVFKDSFVSVYFDDERVQHLKKRILAPGEMEQVILQKKKLQEVKDLKTITIKIEAE